MVYYIICILTYFVPMLAYKWARVPMISPMTAVIIFYYMEFGPHGLLHGPLRLSSNPQPIYDHRYVIAITIANIMIGVGIVAGRYFASFSTSPSLKKYSQGNLIANQRSALILLGIAILYMAIFMALDGPGLPRLRSHILFLFNESKFSYDEIRRELFSDSLIDSVMSYTRQTTTAVLVGLIFLTAIRVKGILRAIMVVFGLMVFVVCALQLNKFPVFYYIGSLIVTYYVVKTCGFDLSKRALLYIIIGIPTFLIALFVLYTIQYRSAIGSGILTYKDLEQLVLYRPFHAQSDALRLWFEEFPDKTPYLGIRNINLLASIFGLKYFNVTLYIPMAYIGSDQTTFQAGFIGSGYASFGYFGVLLYAFIVGFIGILMTKIMLTIKSSDFRAVYCGVMFFNMYFLFSRELSTALLSGGIAPVAILGLTLGRLAYRNKKKLYR